MARETGSKHIVVQGRLSYANLYEKRPTSDEDTEGAYSTSIIIPKTDTETLKVVAEAIEAATKDGMERFWKGKKPQQFSSPLKDADLDDSKCEDPNYKGCYFINAKNRREAPQVCLCKNGKFIHLERSDDPDEKKQVYSGCYARVSLTAFAYDKTGHKGVSFILGNVLKVADGERLAGGSRAEEDFEPLTPEQEKALWGDNSDYDFL